MSAEVLDIADPMIVNASWDSGVLFNCSVNFRKVSFVPSPFILLQGAVRIPSDVYTSLVSYIIDKNAYQVGESHLFINPYQEDPNSACFKVSLPQFPSQLSQNTCHPKGVCTSRGPNAYECKCGPGYRDLNPSDPGRRCLPTEGFNECERPEDNECSENARCIDLEHLYKCECLPSFTDASPPGKSPSSFLVFRHDPRLGVRPRLL